MSSRAEAEVEGGGLAAPAKARPDTRIVIPKHHALVRLAHWLNVPVLFLLIASGLSIYWASPVFEHARDPVTGSTDYLADLGIWAVKHVPGLGGSGKPSTLGGSDTSPSGFIYRQFGLGTFRLAPALRIHWLFAYAFMAVGLLYFLGLAMGGGWRALLPRRSDAGDALRMVRYYAGVVPAKLLRRPWPHPPVRSKYNALQRGAYFSMPVLGILAVASGWAMHKPVGLSWLERLFVNYNGARIVHFAVMLAFASFVIPHVVLVIADGWDTFRSMIVGWSERRGGSHDGK